MDDDDLPVGVYPGGRKKASKRGRKLALNPDLIDKIAAYVRHGCYIETAMGAVGMDRTTWTYWSKKGRSEPDSIYGTFIRAMDLALAEAEARDVLRISEGAKKDWKAAAWKLERRWPRRWGRRDEVDVSTNQSIRFTTSIAEDTSLIRRSEILKDSGREDD